MLVIMRFSSSEILSILLELVLIVTAFSGEFTYLGAVPEYEQELIIYHKAFPSSYTG